MSTAAHHIVPERVLLRDVHEDQLLHGLEQVCVLDDVVQVHVSPLQRLLPVTIQVSHLQDEGARGKETGVARGFYEAGHRGVPRVNLQQGGRRVGREGLR